jgi:hypothetical protein
MKAKLIWILIVMASIFALPLVHAEDGVTVNQTNTIDVGIVANGQFFSVAGANISIFSPLNRNVVVNNQPMTMLSTGQYYYNYVPNETGVYYYVFEFTNGTHSIFQAGGSFTSFDNVTQNTASELDNMLGTIPYETIATLFGFAFIIFMLFYVSFKLDKENFFVKSILAIVGFILLFSFVGFLEYSSTPCVLDYSAGNLSKVCLAEEPQFGSTYVFIFSILLFIILLYIVYILFLKPMFDRLKQLGAMR